MSVNCCVGLNSVLLQPIKPWLQLRFDCDTTTIRLRRIARARINMSVFRRSRVVAVSQSNRNCDRLNSQLIKKIPKVPQYRSTPFFFCNSRDVCQRAGRVRVMLIDAGRRLGGSTALKRLVSVSRSLTRPPFVVRDARVFKHVVGVHLMAVRTSTFQLSICCFSLTFVSFTWWFCGHLVNCLGHNTFNTH